MNCVYCNNLLEPKGAEVYYCKKCMPEQDHKITYIYNINKSLWKLHFTIRYMNKRYLLIYYNDPNNLEPHIGQNNILGPLLEIFEYRNAKTIFTCQIKENDFSFITPQNYQKKLKTILTFG